MKECVFNSDGSASSLGGVTQNSYTAYSIRTNTTYAENIERNTLRLINNIRPFTNELVTILRAGTKDNSEEQINKQQTQIRNIFAEASRLYLQLAKMPDSSDFDLKNRDDLRKWVNDAAVALTWEIQKDAQEAADAMGEAQSTSADNSRVNENKLGIEADFERMPIYRYDNNLNSKAKRQIDQHDSDSVSCINDFSRQLEEDFHWHTDLNQNADVAHSEFISDAISIVFLDKSQESTILSKFTNRWENDSMLNSSSQSDAAQRNSFNSALLSIPLSNADSDSRKSHENEPSSIPDMIAVDFSLQSNHNSDYSLPLYNTDVMFGIESVFDMNSISSFGLDSESQSRLDNPDSRTAI